MKSRESIIGLMYNLFDKEATRAILASQATSRKPTEIMSANFNQAENQTETRSEIRFKRRDEASRDQRKDVVSVQINNVCSSSTGSRNYVTTIDTSSPVCSA